MYFIGFVKVIWKKHVQANIRVFWKYFLKKTMWIQERPQHTTMPLRLLVRYLTNLSKAFDCLDHELLIAKLNAYGFGLPALRLINNYLSHRKQRTRVNNSLVNDLLLGQFLFKSFLAGLFLIHSDINIANYIFLLKM